MAEPNDDTSDQCSPTVAPIRSILKKVFSDTEMTESDLPRPKKSITFNTDITTHWGSSKRPTKETTAESDKPSNGDAYVETTEDMDVDGRPRRNSRSKMYQLRSGLKTKMGGVLHRLGRSQIQGGGGDMEASGGVSLEKGNRMKRRASDMSESAEHFDPKRHSQPRAASVGSSELFTPSNKSLRSKFMRFGQRFKPEPQGSGGGEPVLTKVTRLGGLGVGVALVGVGVAL